MTTIPVIVQARMSSTRLPGKVLMPWGSRTFLEHCLDRCARIEGISDVICATTDSAECDPIAELCSRRGYRVHRGSESDVLSRYLGAAREARADAIIRITSDCPLTDPAISTSVVNAFLHDGGDLVTTNIPASWPLGMDSELVTMRALEDAAREGRTRSDREHVTTFVRNRPLRYVQRNLPCPDEGHAHLRITLDTPQDRAFFEAVLARYPGNIETVGWEELFRFLKANPDVAEINTNESFP